MDTYDILVYRHLTREEESETLTSAILAPSIGLQMRGSPTRVHVVRFDLGWDYLCELFDRINRPEDGVRIHDVDRGFEGAETRGFKHYYHRVVEIGLDASRLARLMLKEPSMAERVSYFWNKTVGRQDVYCLKKYLLTDIGESAVAKHIRQGIFYHDENSQKFKSLDES